MIEIADAQKALDYLDSLETTKGFQIVQAKTLLLKSLDDPTYGVSAYLAFRAAVMTIR